MKPPLVFDDATVEKINQLVHDYQRGIEDDALEGANNIFALCKGRSATLSVQLRGFHKGRRYYKMVADQAAEALKLIDEIETVIRDQLKKK